jgi:hypothetical protein
LHEIVLLNAVFFERIYLHSQPTDPHYLLSQHKMGVLKKIFLDFYFFPF